MTRFLRRVVAWAVLAASFGGTLIVARILGSKRSSRPARDRVLVTGTFYNHGWFLSHIAPIASCGMSEVIVVTDTAREAPERVTVLWPSRSLVRCVGRAAAKTLLLWRAGRQLNPYLYMGYHLFPAGLSALLVARLHGRAAAYQMTGGSVEWLGGGYANENFLMNALGRPSRVLETLALAVIRQFDLVVVRGRRARRELEEKGIENVAMITGSVRLTDGTRSARSIDMIFVGRLAPIKQPEQFVEIVGQLVRSRPSMRAIMIGAGPELHSLQRQASGLGVEGNIEFLGARSDVSDFLEQSKVFVLTSRSEGLSIALMEAMSCGVPGVVADVGELSDVVVSGVNGWLVPPNDLDGYVERISGLLDDPVRWQKFSNAAREAATELGSIENVARRWRVCLEAVAGRAAG